MKALRNVLYGLTFAFSGFAMTCIPVFHSRTAAYLFLIAGTFCLFGWMATAHEIRKRELEDVERRLNHGTDDDAGSA